MPAPRTPSAEPPPPDPAAIARLAARAADDKLGRETVIIDVGPVLALAELFVLTSGTNDRQVKAICEEVERRVKEAGGGSPLRIEGLADARWVLLDYGDVIVHVFLEEARAFYDIERLWSDMDRLEWAPGADDGGASHGGSAGGETPPR